MWMLYNSFTSSLRSAFSDSLINLAASFSSTTGGMGFKPLFFLIWERDNVVCRSSANGSVKSRIALEISLEFLNVVRAWWWIDLRNFVKSCPLCSVLVPKVSIFAILGMNGDEGLLSIRGLLETTCVGGAEVRLMLSSARSCCILQ